MVNLRLLVLELILNKKQNFNFLMLGILAIKLQEIIFKNKMKTNKDSMLMQLRSDRQERLPVIKDHLYTPKNDQVHLFKPEELQL